MVDDSDDATIGRRTLLAGAGAALTAALSGCIGGIGDGSPDVTETVTRSYETDGLTDVTVSSPNGEITVRGSDRETVDLTAKKRADSQDLLDAATVSANREGSELSIVVEVDDDATGFLETPPQVDIDLRLPSNLRLARIDTANGKVDVSGVRGPLNVDAVNGDVTVSEVDGAVTVGLTNGEITVSDVTGDVRAEATNGKIDVENVDGDVVAETTNGDIDVSTVTGDATVDTVNGDVSVSDVDGDVDR